MVQAEAQRASCGVHYRNRSEYLYFLGTRHILDTPISAIIERRNSMHPKSGKCRTMGERQGLANISWRSPKFCQSVRDLLLLTIFNIV